MQTQAGRDPRPNEARTIPAKLPHHGLSAGRPDPLGATWDGEGTNFAVFSADATLIELCLFSDDGRAELARIPLRERDGDVWHVYVAGLTPGARYGFRAHGPYVPDEGLRFNPNKLLLDPYARRLTGKFRQSDALLGYQARSARADLSFDSRDSAFAVPKCIVTDPSFHWGEDRPPRHRRSLSVHYEAHVKGMTAQHPGVDRKKRGSFLGLCSAPVLDHLVKLGVTTVQLMPVMAHLDERFLAEKGLVNYWGYQTVGFFAPDPRFLRQNELWEFQTMVRRFHSAGIEVILDVVYNHTGEGNQLGPTVCFRGLDNRSYYRLAQNPRFYEDVTGTGNSLNLDHPAVLRLVMDSLRYWVEAMHVDGFRFDLATTLARGPAGFDPTRGFVSAIRQDPVLNRVKLVAEPWDVGHGGYQLGQFPHPFMELNDRFRDGVRRFWRGEAGATADLASRLLGSADLFDHDGRAATSSVNFVTSHDGFTLEDLVSFNAKHNWANGEENRDGHEPNFSDNMGVEGQSEDPAIRAARARRKRNLLATLFLAQGTPMLLAGDEIGNSQGGNNNAYAQDNPVGWVGWDRPDRALTAFVGRLARLRRDHPVLRQRLFLHALPRHKDGIPDVFWRKADGSTPTPDDWRDPGFRTVCIEIRASSFTPAYSMTDDVVFVVVNGDGAAEVTLPETLPGQLWHRMLDTAEPDAAERAERDPRAAIAAQSVALFAQRPA
ncbi:glycogen debranching protein GlgX [Frigidibacter oleivorans]|uniref:glycogen debranching protein GlgX n=1 Tax=Frigidibacter oleivorans TaxID=2487129 RepID=UPI000F8E877C|nr:glycogen debranching protein GlgX [Frigidibacter oleivorans]